MDLTTCPQVDLTNAVAITTVVAFLTNRTAKEKKSLNTVNHRIKDLALCNWHCFRNKLQQRKMFRLYPKHWHAEEAKPPATVVLPLKCFSSLVWSIRIILLYVFLNISGIYYTICKMHVMFIYNPINMNRASNLRMTLIAICDRITVLQPVSHPLNFTYSHAE